MQPIPKEEATAPPQPPDSMADIKQEASSPPTANTPPDAQQEEANDEEQPRPKPVIQPIFFDLEPSPTAESVLKARIAEERKKQLERRLRFSVNATTAAAARIIATSPVDASSSVAASAASANAEAYATATAAVAAIDAVNSAVIGQPPPVDEKPSQVPNPVTETTILGARRAAIRRGFATGFDTTSPDEEAKRQARIARFGPPESHPFYKSDDDAVNRAARALKFGPQAFNEAAALSNPPPLEPKRTVTAWETPRENVLHLFGVDEMRTNDVVGHFMQYGPSWCEWLNDSSCNIVFEDPHTLRRVLRGMSSTATPTGTPAQSMDNIGDTKKDGEDTIIKMEPKADISDVKMSDEAPLPDELTWRPLRPFIQRGRVFPLWGRMATTTDKRPERPNPQSKWSRTVHRQNRMDQDSGLSSDPSMPRRRNSSRRSLGVSEDTKISKPMSRKASKMDIDNSLTQS